MDSTCGPGAATTATGNVFASLAFGPTTMSMKPTTHHSSLRWSGGSMLLIRSSQWGTRLPPYMDSAAGPSRSRALNCI